MAPQPPSTPGPGGNGGLLRVTVLPGGKGIRLAGDADLSTIHRLRTALASLPDRSVIHVHLADLRFIDVAGTRELVTLTESHPSCRLVLHDPPRTLRRLIFLLWPEASLEIHDATPQALRCQPGHCEE